MIIHTPEPDSDLLKVSFLVLKGETILLFRARIDRVRSKVLFLLVKAR